MVRFEIIDNINLSEEYLQRIISTLPQWRREEALKYKHVRGRAECALSYHLLSEMIGFCPDFVIGEHGKPYAKGHDELYFNLSHCRNAIGCVVGDVEVGMDVECLGRYKETLARHCMNDAECELIMSADDPDIEFTKLWTRKEAVLKLSGDGIIDDLKLCLDAERIEGVTFQEGVNIEKSYAWCVAHR